MKTRTIAAALCCLLLAACASPSSEGVILTNILKHHEAR